MSIFRKAAVYGYLLFSLCTKLFLGFTWQGNLLSQIQIEARQLTGHLLIKAFLKKGRTGRERRKEERKRKGMEKTENNKVIKPKVFDLLLSKYEMNCDL
jgi:hypothetical protein